MAAYRLTWGSEDHRDQLVVFSYYPRPYAENPFRPLQSFRAGGDILIAAQSGKEAFQISLTAGQIARSYGLTVNKISLDSLSNEVLYKYPRVLIVLTDTLTITQNSMINNMIAKAPERSIAIAGLFDTLSLSSPSRVVYIPGKIIQNPGYISFIKSLASAPQKQYLNGSKLSLHLDK